MKAIYPKSILHQFIYESEEWGRLLAFLKQENVFHKSRLAEIVSTTGDEDVITQVEIFNEDFLAQDRIIEFLTEELKNQNDLLESGFYLDGELMKDVIRHQKKLKADVEKAEEIFSGAKKNFSGFLNSLL